MYIYIFIHIDCKRANVPAIHLELYGGLYCREGTSRNNLVRSNL